MIHRRKILQGSAALAVTMLSPWRAKATTSRFQIGQLNLGESWNPRPDALSRLQWELEKRTSITTTPKPATVDLADARLRDTPYLYLAGDREFSLPPPELLKKLRRFLAYGGFLHIDSAEGVVGGAFDQSVRLLVSELFPAQGDSLEIVSHKHVVYKSFYLIDYPVGRIAITSSMMGVEHDGRLVVAYTENDLGGAWTRDDFGNFHHQCIPGGERQRELAFRLGVNLAMYALCLDYKSDQVHVPHIMRRRRWRPDDDAEELEN